MNYVEQQPSGDLSPYLECLWAVWDDGVAAPRPPERIVPDGCPELILHAGDAFERLDANGRWQIQPRAFLAGTLTRPWVLRPGVRPRTIGVRFRPGAAGPFLNLSMKGAVDRETPLADIAGSLASEMVAAVGDAPSIEDSLAATAACLARWLARRAVAEPVVRPAVDRIMASRGRSRVEEIARSLGWSRRRLERAFERELGISPKLFARIVRLNAVLATLDEAQRASAVDLALEAGYFDQSHLLHDFRELAGAAPRRIGTDTGDFSQQLIRPERLRSLLAGE